MELRELHVTRLPGIDESFVIKGAPGLNLVLGPNGSGKSSLSRAALGLLWPDPATTGQIVSAAWDLDGKAWFCERPGGPAVSWQRDGVPAEAPELAAARHAGIYSFGVLDLLKSTADRTDHELATEIRRQLAGGVDLARLRKQFGLTEQEGRGPAKALKETRQRIRGLKEKLQRLAEEEARLGELGRQLGEAVDAAVRRDALAAGRSLADAGRALQDANDELAIFPGIMAQLRDGDDELLASRTAAREEADDEVARAGEAIVAATRDRDAADLADGGPDDATLDQLSRGASDARDLAADLRVAEDGLAAAAVAVEHVRAQLGSIEPPPSGDPVTVEQAAAAVARLRERDRDRATRDGLDRLLGRDDLGRDGASVGDPASLESARKALSNWLAAKAPPAPWPLRALPWLAVTGLLAVGVALLPWQIQTWPGWFALGLGAALIPAWLLLERRSRRSLARARQEARAAYAATEIAEPESWNREMVARTLRGLLIEEAAAAQARLRDQLRLTLQGERDQTAARLGDDDPDTELDQAQILQRVAAWHTASAAHAAAQKQRNAVAARLAALREQLADRLAPWWRGDHTDHNVLGSAVADLERRRQRHRDASARLQNATDQRDAARKRHAAAVRDLAALLARLELEEDGAAAAIADLVARRDAYLAARESVARCTMEQDRCRRVCDELPAPGDAVARGALAMAATGLDTAIADAAQRAAGRDDLQDTITAIRTRVSEARNDAQFGEERTREEACVRDLAAVRDTVRGNALVSLLLERAAARYEAATEPPLLRRTEELFARFTDGRYRLAAVESDSGATFRATDSSSGRGLALAELSDGTRAQLLLAARLAALPEHERGARPPLFLDESLTASDAVRFEAVGKAILDLVRRDGRQVFYLTCDQADVAAWQRLLETAGEAPAPVIDLAAVRKRAQAAAPERLRPPQPAAVPEPTGDAAAYGEAIGVPPIDATQDLDAVHLFHLLRDDLALLAALLRRRIAHYGQYAAFADDLRADGTVAEAAGRRLETRGRALTAFLDAFATGRGRPIPAGALLYQSGIATSLIEDVEDLAGRLGGDAERLVAALEAGQVKRLHQGKKEEIAGWLVASGYLDQRPVLEPDEVRLRVIRSLRTDPYADDIDWPALDMIIDGWWYAAGGAD